MAMRALEREDSLKKLADHEKSLRAFRGQYGDPMEEKLIQTLMDGYEKQLQRKESKERTWQQYMSDPEKRANKRAKDRERYQAIKNGTYDPDCEWIKRRNAEWAELFPDWPEMLIKDPGRQKDRQRAIKQKNKKASEVYRGVRRKQRESIQQARVREKSQKAKKNEWAKQHRNKPKPEPKTEPKPKPEESQVLKTVEGVIEALTPGLIDIAIASWRLWRAKRSLGSS